VQTLSSVSEKVKNFAILYCVDIEEVRRGGRGRTPQNILFPNPS